MLVPKAHISTEITEKKRNPNDDQGFHERSPKEHVTIGIEYNAAHFGICWQSVQAGSALLEPNRSHQEQASNRVRTSPPKAGGPESKSNPPGFCPTYLLKIKNWIQNGIRGLELNIKFKLEIWLTIEDQITNWILGLEVATRRRHRIQTGIFGVGVDIKFNILWCLA